MNPTEQQIAIVKACGWREAFPRNEQPHPATRKGGIMLPYRWVNELDNRRAQELPDYLYDLNAMHAAEKMLTEQNWVDYLDALESICRPPESALFCDIARPLVHATAAQRAEAFLRTLNLWKE